ncbi:MAG: hypothetical protein R2849_16285 [Thermomicrobiales bacterium]
MTPDIPPPPVQPLRASPGRVELIDQTLLPGQERWILIETVEDMHEAIRSLRIRGAPAIGIAAAYGMAIAADASAAESREQLLSDLRDAGQRLEAARPTAINLAWAIRRVLATVNSSDEPDLDALRALVWSEAAAIKDEDLDMCRRIGLAGASLLSGDRCSPAAIRVVSPRQAMGPLFR